MQQLVIGFKGASYYCYCVNSKEFSNDTLRTLSMKTSCKFIFANKVAWKSLKERNYHVLASDEDLK